MARDSTCGNKTWQKKLRSRRNGPNRAKLPLFSETGRKPKRPKFNGCLMIQVFKYVSLSPSYWSNVHQLSDFANTGAPPKASTFVWTHQRQQRLPGCHSTIDRSAEAARRVLRFGFHQCPCLMGARFLTCCVNDV